MYWALLEEVGVGDETIGMVYVLMLLFSFDSGMLLVWSAETWMVFVPGPPKVKPTLMVQPAPGTKVLMKLHPFEIVLMVVPGALRGSG